MSDADFVLFGAGNMGGAIAEGWLAANPGARLTVIAPNPRGRVTNWEAAGRAVVNPQPSPAGLLMIAVKPQVFPTTLEAIRAWIGPETVVVSVMAGLTLAALEDALGTKRLIRVMPNTPSSIGKGVALLSPGAACTETDITAAKALMAPLGHVEGPMSEEMLQAAMGLSGCGPAYVFLLAEVLAEAAVAQGVPNDMAKRLAVATIEGSASLLAQSDSPPEELRRAVTSPNGVTQAALEVLMADDAMPSLFRDALAAAVARDRELSAPPKGET